MLPTLKAWRAFSSSLFYFNSRVDEVKIRTFDGVFRLMFGFCIEATSATALSPRMDMEPAVLMNAVFLDGSGGAAQPKGL